MKITIDELIKRLEVLKREDGCSGDTQVFLKTSSFWVNDIHNVNVVSVSKTDFNRGKGQCGIVSNRGVKVVIVC